MNGFVPNQKHSKPVIPNLETVILTILTCLNSSQNLNTITYLVPSRSLIANTIRLIIPIVVFIICHAKNIPNIAERKSNPVSKFSSLSTNTVTENTPYIIAIIFNHFL